MNRPTRCLLAFLFFAPVAIFAAKADGPKARAMAKYDLNHNGKLEGDELAAIQKDYAATPTGDLARFDTDKDGKLSPGEIAKMIPGSGKKKEPKPRDAAKQTQASAQQK